MSRLVQWQILLWLIIFLTLSACAPASTSTPLPTAVEVTLTPAGALEVAQRPTPPAFGEFDPATVNDINLADYPVLPTISPSVRTIYQAGLARGNNPHVFAKLGDNLTNNPHFLVPFSQAPKDVDSAFVTLFRIPSVV